MLLCFPGWACQRSLCSWRGKEARVVGHREQWHALEKGGADGSWIPEGDWEMLTWSMGTWTGLALSELWEKNPPKSWLALSPFLKLSGDGCKVKDEELKALLSSFKKNPSGTLGMFEKRQGGKAEWTEGLEETDYDLLGRTLEALLQPCPWPLAGVAAKVSVKIELGLKDRLVGEEQSRAFASLFEGAEVEIFQDRNHALFYEDDREF